jgi:hypothetical protein
VCAFIEDECARFVSTFFSKKTLTLKKLIFNLIFYILLYIYIAAKSYHNKAEFSSKLFLRTSNFSIISKLSYTHKLLTFPSHHFNFNQTFNFSVN